MTLDREPRKLKVRIIPNRGTHRSTLFQVMFDTRGLIAEDGTALIEGDELEELLVDWCRQGIRSTLARGRAKIPNHP